MLFEVRPGLKDTLIVREVDDAFHVAVEQTFELERGAAFFHDVAITERYYLVMQWASVSLPTFLWGAAPVASALRFDPSTTPMIHLLPRAGGKPISIPLPGGRTHFHLWNAYEADGKVIADAIGYPGAVRFASLVPESVRRSSGAALETTPPTATWRYTLDLAGRSVRDEKLTDLCAEAPENRADRRGRPYRFRWAPSAGTPGDEVDHGAFNWLHALARHDFQERSTQLWDAGPRAYVSAAAFASRAGASAEDDGYVLAFIQDTAANATTVGIFDARDIASGPIARLSGAGLLGAITHVAFA